MGRAMTAGILTLILILLPAVAGILASYVLYRIIFCYPQKKRLAPGKLPESRMYAPWTERLKESCLLMDRMPFEKLTIRAEDDLTLQGRLYEGETCLLYTSFIIKMLFFGGLAVKIGVGF